MHKHSFEVFPKTRSVYTWQYCAETNMQFQNLYKLRCSLYVLLSWKMSYRIRVVADYNLLTLNHKIALGPKFGKNISPKH